MGAVQKIGEKVIEGARSVLFEDPWALYREEIGLLDKPFFFQGNSKKGVLLIHGWTSAPYEIRRLGKFLNENEYTVSAPVLSGHCTVPKDLEGIKWERWLDDVEREYDNLKKNCAEVYVAGTSMGANLAVLLSLKNKDMKGMVLMAMPLRLQYEKLAVGLARIIVHFRKYNKKYYPPSFGLEDMITRRVSYQTYPIKSALESFSLIKHTRNLIPEVTVPCLVMQSTSDHIVSKDSMDVIYNNIKSERKKKISVDKAYHTFISDVNKEHVFRDILNFLNEN